MKKVFLILFALLFTVSLAQARGLTTGDQAIYGNKTFENNLTVKGDATFDGPILGVNRFSSIFYVDSNTGHDSSGSHGKTYAKPFATLEYAINQCTAGKGDIIYVMPSHNEAVTTAGAIDFDIDGIFVIGLGTGDDKPTIDFDAAAGSVAVGADNVTIQNIRFRTSYNAVTVGLDIEDGSCNVRVIGCEFGWAETATDEFNISLRTGDASNEILIENCIFNAGGQAAVEAILFNKDTDHTILRNNYITGNYSTAPIAGATTASTNLLIEGNRFYTGGSADTFNLVAASTGIVADNYIVMNAASAANALDIGNCVSIQNYLIADDDVGGDNSAIEAGAFASVTATADD